MDCALHVVIYTLVCTDKYETTLYLMVHLQRKTIALRCVGSKYWYDFATTNMLVMPLKYVMEID